MIVTVTLNPAYDKALSVDTLTVGELHRVSLGPVIPSGKGVNVARVLHRWGVATKAMIMAGEGTQALIQAMDTEHIPHRMISVSGQVRVNIKLYERSTGRMTELNEPGPQVTTSDLAHLEDVIDQECADADIVVFAGSLPQGAPTDLYAHLVQRVTRLGCRSVIDSSGAALRAASTHSLFAMKPNYSEALELLGYCADDSPSIDEVLSKLTNLDVAHMILTLGSDGAYFLSGGQIVHTIPPQVTVGNTAGAGDSLLATYLAGLELGWSHAECAVQATAAGTAAVQGLGTDLCTPESVKQLCPYVSMSHHRI